jgi:hypothetical protein
MSDFFRPYEIDGLDGLGSLELHINNSTDVPNFWNEHRSISEIDADDIPGPGQLQNWLYFKLDDCLSDQFVYTINGEGDIGEDLNYPRSFVQPLGYGLVDCPGIFGVSAVEDNLTEGEEEFSISIWSDRYFSKMLYSKEFSIVDHSLSKPVADEPTPIINNIVNNNIVNNNVDNNTNTTVTNTGDGDIKIGNIGTVENSTNITNTLSVQTITIDLSLAITGESKKKETVNGTSKDDIIADGAGKDRLVGNDGADQFYFSGNDMFKKKFADQVVDFDSTEGDSIVIDESAISNPIITSSVIDDLSDVSTSDIPVAENPNMLKELSDDGHEFVYNEFNGEFLFDNNGTDKGFAGKGEDPIIANIGKKTVLTDNILDDIVEDLNSDPTFAIAESKKELKNLSKNGYDLLYFEPKGDLYIDGNGDSKGFGNKSEGGMITDLPDNTTLTESDVLIGI